MDCKCEIAARTFIRIEALLLQGLMHGILIAVFGVLAIPIFPFAYAAARWQVSAHGFVTRFCLVPLWFAMGVIRAVTVPFSVAGRTVSSLSEIARAEWETRWMTGMPKKPDGHPLKLETDDERGLKDFAYTVGVIRDYNAEAREYGQGLPIDETEL